MIHQKVKEEHAIVLDFLPHGYPGDTRPMHRKTPIAQAIGKEHFVLLELIPKKDQFLQPYEEVYLGEGKREKIHHILGRLPLDRLTETAKHELEFVIVDLVKKKEDRFVEFFNNANPINTRRHMLELLPGIGKRHMLDVVKEREEREFTSFDDIKERVKLIPDPEKVIVKRILKELNEEDKHRLFTPY